MAHEVRPIIDELLYLRERYNAAEPEALNLADLSVFLSDGAAESRAKWAKDYMRAAAEMGVGSDVQFQFGGHTYRLTKTKGY